MDKQYIQHVTNNIHAKVEELNSVLEQATRANMSVKLGIDIEKECLVTIGSITHHIAYNKMED